MQINGINLGLLNFTNVNKLIKKKVILSQFPVAVCLILSLSLSFFFPLRRLCFQYIPPKLILPLSLPSPSLPPSSLSLSLCLLLSVRLPFLPIYHIRNVLIIIVSSFGFNTVSFLSLFPFLALPRSRTTLLLSSSQPPSLFSCFFFCCLFFFSFFL